MGRGGVLAGVPNRRVNPAFVGYLADGLYKWPLQIVQFDVVKRDAITVVCGICTILGLKCTNHMPNGQ